MDIDILQVFKDLEDEDDKVKEQAYRAYKELKQVPLERWLVQICDADAEKRAQAAYALGITRKREAVELVIAALKDTSSSVRKAAAWSLGFLDDKKAVESLYMALDDVEAVVRKEAAYSLGELHEFFRGNADRLIGAYIKALSDPCPEVRASAVYSLGKLPGDNARNAVLSAFEDENEEVRLGVVEALGKHSGFLTAAAHTKLIQLLNSPVKHMRLKTIESLEDFRADDVDIIDALIEALHDPDPDIRAAAAESLNTASGIRANQALAKAIDDEDLRVKACAIETTGYIGGDGVYEKLIGYLTDPSDDIRAGAARGLGGLGDNRALDELVRLFENDPSPQVRRAALLAIASLDEDNKKKYLLKGLEDKSSIVRTYASDAIDFEVDAKTVEPVAALLDDYDADVRANAVWALGLYVEMIGWDEEDSIEGTPSKALLAARALVDEKATDLIINALDDVDDLVRGWALDALMNIGSEHAVEHLVKMVEEGHPHAMNALGEIKHPGAIEPMLKLLKSEKASEREHAIEVLGSYHDPQFTDLLLAAISDPDSSVRAKAAVKLWNKNDPRIVDALLPLLADEDREARSNAIAALGHHRAEKAVGTLKKALDDPEAMVRESVARALIEISTPESERALLDHFCSEKPEIVRAASDFFIRKGIPGTEQIFLDALKEYGWSFADDLAFCGNPVLEDAGRAYYREHYFPSKPKERENSPKWGSDRQAQ